MSAPALNNIELPAADMATAMTFYTDVFEWDWTEYGPTYSDAQTGSLTVGLSTAATPAALPPEGDQSGIGPLVSFQVRDLDASIAAVTGAGGEVVTETFDFPGGSRFHFRDPSGNVLGIYRIDD